MIRRHSEKTDTKQNTICQFSSLSETYDIDTRTGAHGLYPGDIIYAPLLASYSPETMGYYLVLGTDARHRSTMDIAVLSVNVEAKDCIYPIRDGENIEKIWCDNETINWLFPTDIYEKPADTSYTNMNMIIVLRRYGYNHLSEMKQIDMATILEDVQKGL